MLFWIISAALALLIAALFALALLTRRAEAEHPAAYDLRIYRDQLKEVERDLARGVINEADAERIRTEVGRRVLAADAQLAIADVSSQQPRALTIVIAATIALIPHRGWRCHLHAAWHAWPWRSASQGAPASLPRPVQQPQQPRGLSCPPASAQRPATRGGLS
jgi:cytochrome c-type biogenesis protein CcmI